MLRLDRQPSIQGAIIMLLSVKDHSSNDVILNSFRQSKSFRKELMLFISFHLDYCNYLHSVLSHKSIAGL